MPLLRFRLSRSFLALAAATFALGALASGCAESRNVNLTGVLSHGGSTPSSGGDGAGGSAGDTAMAGTNPGAGGSVDAGGSGGSAPQGGDGGTAGSVAIGGTGGDGGSGGAAGGAGGGGGGGSGGGDANCPGGSPNCAALKAALVHRYSFTTNAMDSVGTAHGTLSGATVAGGVLTLSGTNQYVDLPNGLLSSLTNASIEAWVTWNGGNAWQRIFDFGSNEMAEGSQGTGATYLFLTAQADDGTATPALRAAYTIMGPGAANESQADAVGPLPTGVETHVAVTVGGGYISLYQDGEFAGSVAFSGALSALSDINNWIGRSQFSADSEFSGTISEFRIYNKALSTSEMATSFTGGPDAPFLL